jgi:ABC-2 type transport system ATP-binding protein
MSASPIPAVDVEGLRVRRGNTMVLQGPSLQIRAGRVTGLLGPSGSGKTTLMRAIAGVQKTHAGVVRVLGRPAGAPAVRRRLGYMTQTRGLYDDLTARENVRYFARIFGAPANRVDETLETVRLSDLADRVVHTLSNGEQARTALATTLVAQPPVLLLDEPTVGLDPLLRRDLWHTFRRLADQGTVLLVSSHVMDEARHCDELLLLREGELLAAGRPDDLLRRTQTDDLAEAFLRLIEQTQAGQGPER